MEDLHELSRELVRDILDLTEDVEAGPADPEHVASKAEELIEVLGVNSALCNATAKNQGEDSALLAPMLRQRARCRTKCLKLAERKSKFD